MVNEETKHNMGIVCGLNILLSVIIESQFFLLVIFASEQKETQAKIVAMATSQYATSCVFLMHNIGAKFQLSSSILSWETLHFVICLHAVTTHDVINF